MSHYTDTELSHAIYRAEKRVEEAQAELEEAEAELERLIEEDIERSERP